jgi:hypothetical protein
MGQVRLSTADREMYIAPCQLIASSTMGLRPHWSVLTWYGRGRASHALRTDESFLGTHGKKAAQLVKAKMWRHLPSTPPDDGNAQADHGDSNPTISADLFAQESFRSEGSRSIAQGTDGHYKTHFLKGKNCQKGEKSQAHQGDAQPHPSQAQRLQNKAHNRFGTKVVHFTDALHCTTYA